jgi:hypothetical protein
MGMAFFASAPARVTPRPGSLSAAGGRPSGGVRAAGPTGLDEMPLFTGDVNRIPPHVKHYSPRGDS